ncbi:hypothetical protein GGX14DRAFT_570028 [Mycena pura]|uniref:Uncharacterized protein n=1 Tax=Mycena pura TaxID=153505 RepID=A0AAD6V835_9AGAR|nr:hypothetical protein GGX14DRAFT_570028 [Mycena pura]
MLDESLWQRAKFDPSAGKGFVITNNTGQDAHIWNPANQHAVIASKHDSATFTSPGEYAVKNAEVDGKLYFTVSVDENDGTVTLGPGTYSSGGGFKWLQTCVRRLRQLVAPAISVFPIWTAAAKFSAPTASCIDAICCESDRSPVNHEHARFAGRQARSNATLWAPPRIRRLRGNSDCKPHEHQKEARRCLTAQAKLKSGLTAASTSRTPAAKFDFAGFFKPKVPAAPTVPRVPAAPPPSQALSPSPVASGTNPRPRASSPPPISPILLALHRGIANRIPVVAH